jgi:hypothetical protein
LLARLRAALDEPVTAARRRAWFRALAAAGPAELGVAGLMLVETADPPRAGDCLPELLMYRWQAVDPAGYLRFSQEHQVIFRDKTFQRMAGVSLAKNDPAALHALLERNPSELNEKTLEGVVTGMAPANLERAVEWVLSSEPVWDKQMMSALANGVCRSTGLDGASRMLAILRRENITLTKLDDALRHCLLILPALPNPDIPAAAAWLRREQSQPHWPADGVSDFLRGFASHHSTKVMDLVQTLGPDPAAGGWPHAAVAMTSLTNAQYSTAAEWLQRHADAPFYDEAALAWTKQAPASIELQFSPETEIDPAAIHARMKDPALRTAAGEIYAAARAAKDNKK